jgi:dCMP deaminase
MDLGKYKKLMTIAHAYAALSKDESTKVGALIVGVGMEVRSSGWNGAPRGSDADVDGRRSRPEKYFWFCHAEANAIANAARAGTSIQDCVMLVTLPPCMDCAKLIVQAGIRTVIYEAGDDAFKERWKDHLTRAAHLFQECGVRTLELPPSR